MWPETTDTISVYESLFRDSTLTLDYDIIINLTFTIVSKVLKFCITCITCITIEQIRFFIMWDHVIG